MPRRKRFEITYRNDTGRTGLVEVMAFSESSARKLIETARGWSVISCKQTTSSKIPPKWEVDHSALRRARKLLGIHWPISITRTSSVKHKGRHALRWKVGNPTPRHYIVADKGVDFREASRILWHELCHAMQSEQAAAGLPTGASGKQMLKAWADASSRSRNYEYSERPIEVEATAYEQCAAYMPLAKEVVNGVQPKYEE